MLIKLLCAFALWPWAVGVLDLASWMLVGHTVSPVTWNSASFTAYALWPIFWGYIIVGIWSTSGCGRSRR